MYSWPCSTWPVGLARGPAFWPGSTATEPRPAWPEELGRAWAATVARGMAQAWPDGQVLNGPVKNVIC